MAQDEPRKGQTVVGKTAPAQTAGVFRGWTMKVVFSLALVAACLVSGCAAYDPDAISKFSDAKLCVTLHDTGSISGIPERNAQAEIDRRGGIDCKPHMAAYWAHLQGWQRPKPTSCSSSVIGNQIFTQCF